jgi:hypothetical protein
MPEYFLIWWPRCRHCDRGNLKCGRGVAASCSSTRSRLPTEMSFSDFYPSELSDITSSDEDDDFVPNSLKRSTTTNKPKRDKQPYTIPNPLRPPRSTSYSVRALYGPSFLPLSPHLAHSSIRTNHRWIDRHGSGLSKRYACLSSCPPMSRCIPVS